MQQYSVYIVNFDTVNVFCKMQFGKDICRVPTLPILMVARYDTYKTRNITFPVNEIMAELQFR